MASVSPGWNGSNPAMPWDSSSLWCAELSDTGELIQPRQLAGGDGVSVFQPQWLPNGQLLVAEDSTGWWNLMLQPHADAAWQRPWPMAAETAMPQWIYGMSTTAWDGEQLIAAVCSRGCLVIAAAQLGWNRAAVDATV